MALQLCRVESVEAVPAGVRRLLADYEAAVDARLHDDYGIVLDDLAPGHDLLTELRSILLPPGFLYFAEVDDAPAGTAALKSLGEGVGELKRMYVDPAFRGRGIARALVERLLADAGDFHTLRLESAVWMVEAHRLYRSVGFVDSTDYAQREFGDVAHSGHLAVFMERRSGTGTFRLAPNGFADTLE